MFQTKLNSQEVKLTLENSMKFELSRVRNIECKSAKIKKCGCTSNIPLGHLTGIKDLQSLKLQASQAYNCLLNTLQDDVGRVHEGYMLDVRQTQDVKHSCMLDVRQTPTWV